LRGVIGCIGLKRGGLAMIPKKIHYCWFGKNPKSKLIEKCILSWEKHLPDYEIIEWNEENYDLEKNDYLKKMYAKEAWAFVADFARLDILYSEGGIYLDTDMEIVKSLNPLLKDSFFIGKESQEWISAGIIASIPKHPLTKLLRDEYLKSKNIQTIPKVITPIILDYANKHDISIYPEEYFYPWKIEDKIKYGLPLMYSDVKKDTFAIHHWAKSWDEKTIDEGTGICVGIKKIFNILRGKYAS